MTEATADRVALALSSHALLGARAAHLRTHGHLAILRRLLVVSVLVLERYLTARLAAQCRRTLDLGRVTALALVGCRFTGVTAVLRRADQIVYCTAPYDRRQRFLLVARCCTTCRLALLVLLRVTLHGAVTRDSLTLCRRHARLSRYDLDVINIHVKVW